MKKRMFAGIVVSMVMLILLVVSSIFADELQGEYEFFQGFRPSNINRSHLQKNPPRQQSSQLRGNVGASSLPSYYDLREHNGVTDVRKQDPWGTCWVFAALGSLESSYKKQYSWENPDLSEMFLAYFAYGDWREGKHFNRYDDKLDILKRGGDEDMVVALLSRLGTVDEYVLPYPNTSYYTRPDKFPEEYETSPIRLKEAYQLGKLTDNLRGTVKELVMNKGAVSVSYYWNKWANNYFIPSTVTPLAGHAVCIVGWDDNFSRSRFTPYTPNSNGAWLVRNSHGANSDKDTGGYFWISYEQDLDGVSMFVADKTEEKLRHYGYDDLGRNAGSPLSWGENTYVANIFQAEASEALKYVGFYTHDNNESYTINIYDLGTSRPYSPTGGTLITSREGYSPYAGYHTEDFTSDRIALAQGHYFSIVMKTAWPAFEGGEGAVVNAGESYYSNDGVNWWDLGEGYRYNACIKAFTTPITASDIALYAPKITTTSFPDAYYGEEYNARISATGATPITYRAYDTQARMLGFMIDGQRLDGAHTSTNGLINGTIDRDLVGARYITSVEITVIAENEWGSDTKIFRFTLKERPVAPTITTTSLPDSYIGESYSVQVQATGTTPITYTLNSGVPSANGFDVSDWLVGLCTNGIIRGTPGYVNGTPTNRTPPYTINFPITVSNAGGESSKTLSVTVYALPSINYTFKNGKTGETYSDYVSVSGGKSPYTWTKNSGTLPDGLSISSSGSSLYLKGTPTKAETYNFSLKVKDANGRTATKSFTITTTTPPSITTNSLKDGIAGTSYSEPLSATGTTPITWSATGLPSGLSCSSAGKISGTPTSSGTFTVRVTASNTAGSTSKTLSLTIKLKPVAPTIDASLPECYVDEEYSGWIRLSGTSPITYSVSGLPSGLTRNSSTGNITGKATSAGSYTIKVNASNSAGSASKSYTLTVKTRPVAPTITTTSLSSGIVGQAYSVTLTATGTTPITWTASGLPGGLSCSTTGKISGTPTAAGSFSVIVTATNSVSTSKNFTLTINSGSDIITPEVEDDGTVPEFKAHQPDLDGIIVVNFYVYMPEIAGVNYNNSYVNFKILNDTSYNPTQEFDPSFTAAGKLGTYYGFRCCVTSVQMADPITATLHYGNGKTVTHTYKLTDYLDKYYSASTTPALLKNVVGAMKDYGKYAQIALSEVNGWEIGKDHIETEAATLYTDSDIEETRQAVEDYAKSWNVGNSGIKSIGYRLALDADTILELFLRPAEGYTGKVSAYSRGVIGITDTGTNLAVKQSDGRYLVQISGIPAHRLDYTNTIRVVTDNGEFDVNVSALSYVNTILNSDKYNSNMKKAVTSLYRYHKAAKAYWESNQKK